MNPNGPHAAKTRPAPKKILGGMDSDGVVFLIIKKTYVPKAFLRLRDFQKVLDLLVLFFWVIFDSWPDLRVFLGMCCFFSFLLGDVLF